jgi:CubicO group peptidase (beta-lactamase class C family)
MRTTLLVLFAIATAGFALAGDSASQKIDQLFAAYDKPNSPGCSVGVVRDGKFVYRKSYGVASLELGVPLTSESEFYLASVSKQFTAASVVLAAEQGYLSLDDNVRKYIPELPDYGHPITLRQMLHHTSGPRDFLTLEYISGREISGLSSPDYILRLIARQKGLNNVPGAEFVYSNSNYFLLGVVVKRATGKSLAEFAAQNIFQPLGMTHTRYYDDNKLVIPNRVAAYDPGKNGTFSVDWSTTFDIVGSGGVMSNVDDLLLWNNNFYANKLGKGTFVSELESRGMLNSGKNINYAMGLWLDEYRGLRTVDHGGGTFGYRTELLRFPDQHFGVIELCNVADVDVSGLARKIADIYLDNDLQPETKPGESSEAFPDPAPFAGVYLDPRTHVVYTFTASGGKLMAWGLTLLRLAANKFSDLVGNPITFEEADGAMTAKLEIEGETYFFGKKVQDLRLSTAELRAVVGLYRSDELDATYRLSLDQERLMLTIGEEPPMELRAVTPAEFQVPAIGTVVFHSDGKRRVIGLTVYSQAARGVDFVKVE